MKKHFQAQPHSGIHAPDTGPCIINNRILQDQKNQNIFKTLLAVYATEPEQLTEFERKQLLEHVNLCPSCNGEFELICRLTQDASQIDETCQNIMETIDWEENAQMIGARIASENQIRSQKRRSFIRYIQKLIDYINETMNAGFSWKLATSVLTSVLLIGVGLGYLLFDHSQHPASNSLENAPNQYAGNHDAQREFNHSPESSFETSSTLSLARLETTLAKKEISVYFQQTQFLLTDLMKPYNTEGAFSFQNPIDMKRVKTLLNKNRYFSQNLDDPQLISSKQLLEKIEWLLIELLTFDPNDRDLQSKMKQLQHVITEEKLLFKIRLFSKDSISNEV